MASAWHVAQRQELLEAAEVLDAVEHHGRRHALTRTRSSLWLLSEWAGGARIACRLAFSPGELEVEAIQSLAGGRGFDVVTSSPIGGQAVTVTFDEDGTISATTTLRAATDLTFEGWPRDIVPDLDGQPQGKVHTSQRGLRTGLVHASLTGPDAGSFMYLQDLTRLGDYCEAAHASAGDTVGGEWPELGFALPSGEGVIREGAPVIVSAWHLALADEVPDEPVAVADQYLQLFAQLYFHIERPTPDHVDWKERADASRDDLERSDSCWLTVDGRRYLRAYVGDDNHPPESMVQLAVLVPLLERSKWSGQDDPLSKTIRDVLGSFHDDRTGMIARWLPSAEGMLDGGEEHEGPRVMDSWYLFHPLLNLARLAGHGDKRARKLLLGSLDRVIEIAHHFHHVWPVFYDIDTLEVIKAESEPGKAGELDVPGLYAHVMLQAYDLTDDQRYLDEALAAAHALRGKGFELTYQTNNVAFGMVALQRLFQLTGDPEWLDISRVLCACLLDNVGHVVHPLRQRRDALVVLRGVPDARDPVHRRVRRSRGGRSGRDVPDGGRRRARARARRTAAGTDPPRHRETRRVLPAPHPVRCPRNGTQDRAHRTGHLDTGRRRRRRLRRRGHGGPGGLRRRHRFLDRSAHVRAARRVRPAALVRVSLRGHRISPGPRPATCLR